MPYCPIDTTPIAAPVAQPTKAVSTPTLMFGAFNAGAQPTWSTFVRTDTRAAVTPPAPPSIVDPLGLSTFSYDWTTAPAGVPSIYYLASCNGYEEWGVISPAG